MKCIVFISAAVVALAVTPGAHAGLDNPGFEANGGSLDGWTVDSGGGNGEVRVIPAAAWNGNEWTAIEGSVFARLYTDTGSGSNKYTTLSQSVYLTEGDTFSFRYFFVNAPRSYDAKASASLLGQDGTPDIPLLSIHGKVDTTPGGIWEKVSSDPIPETGDYLITVRIRDSGSRTTRAILGVDAFHAPGVMPEPLTVLGTFMGVTAIAGYVRKRRTA
jgi:hypothetical protein